MDLDDEEIVETSDVEELAEIQNFRRLTAKSPRRTTGHVEQNLPRKRIKLHHPPTQMFMRLSVSPHKASSSQARSRSSSITLDQSSPSSLFTISRSPTVESQELEQPKFMTTPVQEAVLFGEDGISQDPLLLCTPSIRADASEHEPSTTPAASAVPGWSSSPALQVMQLPSSPVGDRGSDDVAMLFTPVSTPVRLTALSSSPAPLQNPSHESKLCPAKSSPVNLLSTRMSPVPRILSVSQSPAHLPTASPPESREEPEANDHALALALEEEVSRRGGYTLRHRRPAQIRPYRADEQVYMQTLRHNPEAIVKRKALERHRHDSGQYEETQQDVYQEDTANVPEEEDAEWAEQERRRLRREEKKRDTGEADARTRPPGSPQRRFDALLPPPDYSDDEMGDDFSKDAARLKRKKLEEERRRKREEKEEKERRRRLKRFPAIPKDTMAASVASPKPQRSSKTPEREMQSGTRSPEPGSSSMDDLFADLDIPPPIHIPSSPTRSHDAIHNSSPGPSRFTPDLGMDWGVNPSDDNAHALDLAGDMSHVADNRSDVEQREGSDGDELLEDAVDLPRHKLKYLQRLWPTSMIKKAAQGDSAAVKRKKEQRRRERLALGDDGELAPGQSRVRIAARERGSNPIKGDSESEAEPSSDHDICRHHSLSPPRRSRHVIEIPSDPASSEDEVEVLEMYRRPFAPRRRPEPQVEPEESLSAEDTFDEDDLEDYILAPEADGVDHLRDPSLIDYMLTRERPRNASSRLGRSRRRRAPARSYGQRQSSGYEPSPSSSAPRHRYTSSTPAPAMSSQPSAAVRHQDVAEPSSSSSRYRIDVTAAGARKLGHAKQTLLPFHVTSKPQPKQTQTHRPPSSRPTQAAPRRGHGETKASRPSVDYLFRDDYNDERSDPAPRHAPKSRKQSSSRSRTTAIGELGPSRPRIIKSTSGTGKAAASSRRDAEDEETHRSNEKDTEAAARRAAHVRKKRLRKERAKKIGVWCNKESGQIVASGVVRTFVTVDIEDEDFHVSLLPTTSSKEQARHWSHHFRPSPPPPRRRRRRRDSISATEFDGDERQPRHVSTPARDPLQHLSNDMGVPFLLPGKSFEASAYITRGRLHELVNTISGSGDPLRPAPIDILGIALHPDATVAEFCEAFSEITREAFSFSTALPSVSEDELDGMREEDGVDVVQKQWLLLIPAACRMVSWYVRNAQQVEVDQLRESVEKEILQLATQIEEFSFKSINSSVLTVAWFMVEALARVGQSSQAMYIYAKMPKSLKTSVTLLMRLLLEVDMAGVVRRLTENGDLTIKTTTDAASELWVRLIHLFHDPTPNASTTEAKHPFWSLLLEALKQRAGKLPVDSKKSRPFDASEDAWATIFMVNAFSQFSLHGVVAGEPRLPACWDVAVHAMKHIRLKAHEDPQTDVDDLKRHDEYVALLVNRCMVLRQKWHWSLRTASTMFNHVAEIFRSRQFANLYHETDVHLPDFMRLQKLDLVDAYSPKDTAYTVFLKLVVQASREDAAHTREKPSPRIKKLLSLAIPIGALPPYDESSESGRQKCRSMFYNRLAAVAVAIDLDIHSYDERMAKAQNYVPNVSTSHRKLQFGVIGGVTHCAQFFVSRSIRIDALQQWLRDIAAALSTRKQSPGTDSNTLDHVRTNIAIGAALLCSVRHIYTSHLELRMYPDPLLIQVLSPMLKMQMIKHEDMSEHVKLFLEKLFEARYAVLGKPQNPAAVVAALVDEDSQDYWAGNDLPPEAFLDPDDPLKEKEAIMHKNLHESHIRHAISQNLGRSLKPPASDEHRKAYEQEYDIWLRLALSCYSVDFNQDRWNSGIQTINSVIKLSVPVPDDDAWAERIRLSTMYHILLLHPLSYQARIDDAVTSLMTALVSAGDVLENTYVALFLSIGGSRHPLLSGAATLLPATADGTFEFTPTEFADIRLSLFKLILHNMNESDAVSRQKYTAMCINAFSSMKQSLKINRKHNGYEQFCRDVKTALDGQPNLVDDPRFEHWAKQWTP